MFAIPSDILSDHLIPMLDLDEFMDFTGLAEQCGISFWAKIIVTIPKRDIRTIFQSLQDKQLEKIIFIHECDDECRRFSQHDSHHHYSEVIKFLMGETRSFEIIDIELYRRALRVVYRHLQIDMILENREKSGEENPFMWFHPNIFLDAFVVAKDIEMIELWLQKSEWRCGKHVSDEVGKLNLILETCFRFDARDVFSKLTEVVDFNPESLAVLFCPNLVYSGLSRLSWGTTPQVRHPEWLIRGRNRIRDWCRLIVHELKLSIPDMKFIIWFGMIEAIEFFSEYRRIFNHISPKILDSCLKEAERFNPAVFISLRNYRKNINPKQCWIIASKYWNKPENNIGGKGDGRRIRSLDARARFFMHPSWLG